MYFESISSFSSLYMLETLLQAHINTLSIVKALEVAKSINQDTFYIFNCAGTSCDFLKRKNSIIASRLILHDEEKEKDILCEPEMSLEKVKEDSQSLLHRG